MMENLPTPESRVEAYLAKAAGMDVTPPEPKSRLELYLAKIAGMDVEVPEPTTREEHWLAQIVGIEPSEPLAIEGAVYIDNQKVDVRYLAVAAGVTGASLPEEPQNRKEQYWEVIAGNGPTPPTPTIRALKFTSAGAQTLGIKQSSLGTLTPSFEYSNDGQMWNTWDITTSLSFGNGTNLYIRGMNTVLAIATNQTTFVFSQPDNKVTCSGNVMHLFDYTQDLSAFPLDPDSRGIAYLFSGCTALAVPPSLPALTLVPHCYEGLFQDCPSLSAIPALPATNLADQCYRYTFVNCSSIKMSTTQSAEYPNEYVFGTNPNGYAYRMFRYTGGTFTGTANQQTYYTANTIIS